MTNIHLRKDHSERCTAPDWLPKDNHPTMKLDSEGVAATLVDPEPWLVLRCSDRLCFAEAIVRWSWLLGQMEEENDVIL